MQFVCDKNIDKDFLEKRHNSTKSIVYTESSIFETSDGWSIFILSKDIMSYTTTKISIFSKKPDISKIFTLLNILYKHQK